MTDILRQLNKEPLWQQVANVVRRAIQSDLLQPGDHIVERDLEARLGVSRTPIREAIRHLQNQGILDYRANAGTTVAKISREDSRLATELRTFLESTAVRLIYSQEGSRLEATLVPLEEVLGAMEGLREEGTVEEANALDEEFHDALIRTSGSTVLRRAWEGMGLRTMMYLPDYRFINKTEAFEHQRLYVQSGHCCDEHRLLLDVLKSGDLPKSVEALRRHMTEELQRIAATAPVPASQEAASTSK